MTNVFSVLSSASDSSQGQQSLQVGAQADISVRRAELYAKYTALAHQTEKALALANETKKPEAGTPNFEVRSANSPDVKINTSLQDQLRDSGKGEHHEPWYLFQELMRKDREASLHKAAALVQTDGNHQGEQKNQTRVKYVALLNKMDTTMFKPLDAHLGDDGGVLGPGESATTPAPASTGNDNTAMYAAGGIAVLVGGWWAYSYGVRKKQEAEMMEQQQQAMMMQQGMDPNNPYGANPNDPALAGLQPMGAPPPPGAPM